MTSVQALQEASVNTAGSKNEAANPLLMVLLNMILAANCQATDVNSSLADISDKYASFQKELAQLQALTQQLDAQSAILQKTTGLSAKKCVEYQIQSINNAINNARMGLNELQGQTSTLWQGKVGATMIEANTSIQEASQMLQALNRVVSQINQLKTIKKH